MSAAKTPLRYPSLAVAALAVALSATPALGADRAAGVLLEEAEPATYRRHLERAGVAVDLEVEPIREGAAFRQGDPVRVRFRVTDTNTDQPISALYPAAWLDRLPDVPEEQPNSCKQKVESFVGGALLARPELDLNVYYVLALNDDASISVVDPLFGFGTTKLLAMAFLEEPGYDWALTEDQRWLFVSMPEAGKVAVVSTADWKVLTNIEVGPNPGRLAVQPDGEYLWVAYREPLPGNERSGLSVIDVERLRLVDHVETGGGDHAMTFDDTGRHLYVTNRSDGTVSIVDTGALEVVKTLETAADPVSIAHSPAGRAVFVSHAASGRIVRIDEESQEVTARIEAEPGLGEIRFVPDSRLGLVVNPEADVIHVVDASAGRIIQTGDMEDGPDQVGFTDELAYVRHRGSETILMIPLGEIGREGHPMPVVDFPGGQHPAGAMDLPTAAPGIVQAPGATAVLVSNALDKSIYYYKEGMAAPMGHFKNYSRQPRAVQVVDRSLREVEPGVYETAVALRRPGQYDLAFFLDSPRMVHCFDFEVAENPELEAKRKRELEPVAVRYKVDDVYVPVGEEVAVRFELVDSVTKEPRTGIEDVEVLTFLAPGVWQKRHVAEALDGGLYEVRFTPPRTGAYYVFVQSSSQELGFNRSPYLTLMVEEEDEAGEETAAALEDSSEEGPHRD